LIWHDVVALTLKVGITTHYHSTANFTHSSTAGTHRPIYLSTPVLESFSCGTTWDVPVGEKVMQVLLMLPTSIHNFHSMATAEAAMSLLLAAVPLPGV
jgi:hypothetical protein